MTRRFWSGLAIAMTFSVCMTTTVSAQDADNDLAPVPASESAYGTAPAAAEPAPPAVDTPPEAATTTAPANAPATVGDGNLRPVFSKSEVLTAAENVFGRGAEGLARMVETILKDLGQPNAYIVGREGGAAIGVGVRYGQGTLYHKVEGEMPVYWRGPSLGFDIGADGSKAFTLIYRLYDTEALFRAYPAAEGKVYVIGGLTANYVQRGDVVIVPIKLGVGWRLGVNAGYVRYSKKAGILPF